MVPTEQLLQVPAEAAEYWPLAHGEHTLDTAAAETTENMPAAQGLQLPEPVAAEYEPGVQAAQFIDPAPE
jgi:hypothetical protein